MLQNKPQVSPEEITGFVKLKYGLSASCSELDGERDQNFLLTADDGASYILKVTNPVEDDAFIEAQIDVMKFLSGKISLCPAIVKDSNGNDISEIETYSGEKYRTRLVTYFSGKPLALLKNHPMDLIKDLGLKLGSIDKALAGYRNEGFNREFVWDLSNFEKAVKKYQSLVSDDILNSFIDATREEYLETVKPELGNLRCSVIHNDANDHNIIVNCDTGMFDKGPVIEGFIDFGDMLYSYTVANPAVAMAYAMLEKEEPLLAAANLLSGYLQSFQLEENEIRVIFTMAKMRLALSICMAALQQKERPGDKYLVISQEPINNTIPLLEKIHPLFAETVLREYCNIKPRAGIKKLTGDIKKMGVDAFPVLGEKLTAKNCMGLDLGVESRIIESDPEKNSASRLEQRIFSLLKCSDKKYGTGSFAEPRVIYSSPVFQGEQFTSKQDRTVHLGIDLFAPAGTIVYAPLDSTIYAFSYNPGKLDYGHIIILKHETDTGNKFFTLYGHLGGKSFKGLKIGRKLKKGQAFAWIGNHDENGGWASHLHFQIIIDLLGYGTDFPGVSKPWESKAWQILSPDPNILLNIPPGCFPAGLSGFRDTLRKRNEYFSDNLSLSYKEPLKIVRGWQQYLFDQDGQKYLDSYNNVPHVGHCNPEVSEAAYEQMRLLNTNTRYLSDHLNDFAELLLSTFRNPLEVCFFLNSASEANELALRLAFTYTGKKDVIVLEGAYHGNTNTLIDISPYKHNGPGGKGAPSWVHTVPVPDSYRGKYKYSDKDAGHKYAQYVEEITDSLEKESRAPAAFIAETCPSVGGQIIFPPGYLGEVYKVIRRRSGVCIADEVQTGYGRMGTSFYAFEDQGVIPDIVVLGKPIGNGHPLAAVVTTREIADAFNTGMEFFSTFGGNTVSAIVGRKVLEIVLRENYMEHAQKTGSYLLDLLKPFKERYPLVGDIRGSGFFLGIELVRDHESLEPAGEEACYIIERMKQMRILLGTDGPYNNVLKIRPPMPFDEKNAEVLANRLSKIFEEDPLIS
ncbi:MAG: aminotransferase class III-fold pyridoxal phosphate-dependent enzyme [Bacteroidales bacterium]|nr:aminotransferase class III-fold pyridoxal phosphate-dependent enzyme [Bacteroidales bacterium]